MKKQCLFDMAHFVNIILQFNGASSDTFGETETKNKLFKSINRILFAIECDSSWTSRIIMI